MNRQCPVDERISGYTYLIIELHGSTMHHHEISMSKVHLQDHWWGFGCSFSKSRHGFSAVQGAERGSVIFIYEWEPPKELVERIGCM